MNKLSVLHGIDLMIQQYVNTLKLYKNHEKQSNSLTHDINVLKEARNIINETSRDT